MIEEINTVQKALRYNTGKPQWTLMHYKSVEPMIRVLEYGRHKYSIYKDKDGNLIKGVDIPMSDVKDRELTVEYDARDNWKKPMPPKEILDSMQRHIASLIDGEQFDSESGVSHMGHIMCNAMFYNYQISKEEDTSTDNPIYPEDTFLVCEDTGKEVIFTVKEYIANRDYYYVKAAYYTEDGRTDFHAYIKGSSANMRLATNCEKELLIETLKLRFSAKTLSEKNLNFY